MVDPSHAQAIEAVGAFERVIARALDLFRRKPDLFLRDADLIAQMVLLSKDEPALWRELPTADGRATPMLRTSQPSYATVQRGLPAAFDMALLQPSFCRAQPLDVAANVGRMGARYCDGNRESVVGRPLLAVMQVAVQQGLDAAGISQAVPIINALTVSQDQAYHRYAVVFCRHWDLDSHLRRTLHVFAEWAENNPEVALLVAQSDRDEIGGVFGARYFGQWRETAAVDPL